MSLFYCSLDKNSYPMLQDKKIKSAAKLQKNKKIKKCEKLVTHVWHKIKYHVGLYLKINLFTNVFL